jgi:hypothetical protein
MKVILTALFLVSSTLGVFAQASLAGGGNAIPAAVLTGFSNEFGQINAHWIAGQEYEAQFKSAEGPKFAFFSADGTFLGTETSANLTDFPANAQTFLQNSFLGGGNYTLSSTGKRTSPTETLFVAKLAQGNGGSLKLFFNAAGTLVQRQLSQP